MKLTWRILLLVIFLVFSVIAIGPNFEKGVQVKSVKHNSTAFNAGLRAGEIIKQVNDKKVQSIDDYSKAISEIFTDNQTKKKLTITTKNTQHALFTNEPPEITITNIPKTNIRTGLDLQGGARALVKPEKKLTSQELNDLISVSRNRFDVYGISDVKVRAVSDLSGERYMLVEVAGATPSEMEELVAKQGKFEAKIGNETVFVGGKKDITHVARSGKSAGIESCFEVSEGYACKFIFAVSLSEEAAERHAEITKNLSVNMTQGGQYLEKKLDLFLDDNLVDSLLISKDLKGRKTTQISVSGSGTGKTKKEAIENAQESMKKLQTILITGSLPYKLKIVKLDTISPLLGKRFINTILFAGLVAILLVGILVFVRYRKFKATILLLFTSVSEIIIILGVAALIKWNLDLPSIAGILATIGTGIDQQIVILDESTGKHLSLKEKLKRALFIIIAAYFTSFVALLPLMWAGAGLLKGFAITTIIGITSGVLITRPAFADMIKKIEK